MAEISGTSNFYYETLASDLINIMQRNKYICMRIPEKKIGNGSNQRGVLAFTVHDRKAPRGDAQIHNGEKYAELEASALIEILEIDIESSKVTIVSFGNSNAWRKVTEVLQAESDIRLDSEKKEIRRLGWKKEFIEYEKIQEKVKIIFFEAMAAYGLIPKNDKDMRAAISSFLVMTPRQIDVKTNQKGLFIDWCSQETRWRGKVVATKDKADIPILGNVLGFDVDTLWKFYKNEKIKSPSGLFILRFFEHVFENFADF